MEQWRACGHNPIALLDKISLNRYKELENDPEFSSKFKIASIVLGWIFGRLSV